MSILQGEDHLQSAISAQTAFSGPSTQIPAEPDSASVAESRVRIVVVVGLVVVGVVCLVARLLHPFDFIGDQSHGWFLDRLFPRMEWFVGSWSLEMMLSYPFGLLGIFMLERFYPAVPTQKTLSTGVVNDALWVLIKAPIQLIIVATYGNLLYSVYRDHLSFLTLPLAASIPVAVRLVIAIVVMDLATWIQHWVHHHVKWLWPFHAVHHAQRELNLFSETRVHSMEYLVRRPLTMLPMLVLGLQLPEVTWWLLFGTWHAKLQHANIRSNFGPLRYLIVTPQSHRVHHSLRAEHVNHNYGSMLSIWDYLFGTQCRHYDVYPETGIDDEKFPADTSRSVGGVLITPIRQMLYPFRQVWGLWKPQKTELAGNPGTTE